MPLQYPQSSPYNPYKEVKKPKNWPVIILITLGAIALILAVIFVIIPYFNDKSSSDNDNDNGGGLPISTYDCSSDIYNCGNFTTQSEAQVAFDSCFPTAGDVWKLDNDGDGKVCESLIS